MEIDNEYVTLEIGDYDNSSYFSYNGCENCSNGLGDEITPCIAHGEDTAEQYEIDLCWRCICKYANGDLLADNCNNIFEI